MTSASLKKRRPKSAPQSFAVLPSFKVEVLSSIVTRAAEFVYLRKFGLRLVQCRALAVIGSLGPITLRQVSIEVGIDKGRASRLVAGLLRDGFVSRIEDPADQRSFFLILTEAGRRLFDRVFAAAMERNQEWLTILTPAQRTSFIEVLDLLTQHSLSILRQESLDAGDAPDLPLHLQAEPLPSPAKILLVAPAELQELHRRLGELLGTPANV